MFEGLYILDNIRIIAVRTDHHLIFSWRYFFSFLFYNFLLDCLSFMPKHKRWRLGNSTAWVLTFGGRFLTRRNRCKPSNSTFWSSDYVIWVAIVSRMCSFHGLLFLTISYSDIWLLSGTFSARNFVSSLTISLTLFRNGVFFVSGVPSSFRLFLAEHL